MIDKINVIQSSKNFDGNLQSFLRGLDNPQALGRYVLDDAYSKSFFSNFPGLVYRKVSETDRVGDLIYIDEKFNIASGGPGMPGPYTSERQLRGNEAIIDAAYRRDKMTVGMHRYAVAMENYLQSDLLPEQVNAQLKRSISLWATETEDRDVAFTLFRDYPAYYAETDGLTSTQIDERVLPLFGRGTFNDVGIDPTVLMPNGKTDIEDLGTADTLSDVFLEGIQQIADQELGMPTNQLEDQRPFYGLMVGDADVINFFKNASNQFKTSLDSAFRGDKWNHPIYQKFIGEFGNIRMMKYGWMASNDGRDEFADHMSVYKHMRGSVYEPRAQVLAAARGDESITDLTVWTRGAFDLTTPANRAGLDGDTSNFNLYLSLGALDFPHFDLNGSAIVGGSSYNKMTLTATETANAYAGGLVDGQFVGRFQVGESEAAGGKYKILYTGPVYVGKLQLAANKTKYAQVQSVYRMKVIGLYTWDGGQWTLVNDAGINAAFADLKNYLGIDATNHIQVGGQYGGLSYAKRRKAHMFNTIRSILFGKDLIFDADILKGQSIEMEKGDYGAIMGWGMTMSKGKKLVVTPDGTIRNYAVVVYKRPAIITA